MTTLSFSLLALSPFVMSDSDYPFISCPLCKSKTLWNSFMIIGRIVEQDQTTFRVQEWQLWLSYFWSYLPLFCLKLISRLLCKWNTLRNILIVPCRIGQDDVFLTRMTTLPSLLWCYLPLLYLTLIMNWYIVRYVSWTLSGIFWWYLVVMKNRTRWHVT